MLHVAIIMDGNGRWATGRGRPRVVGHRAGAEAARKIVEAAPDHGVTTLSLFAFSSDNWQRPAGEVKALFQLMRMYLHRETPRAIDEGVRIRVIGRRDRLPAGLVRSIEESEAATAKGDVMELRIALDYSGRDAILAAARALRASPNLEITRETFSRLVAQDAAGTACETPGVDLLIRTGGEWRVSDFLLWECAYAELYFTERMWPDFRPADLEAALREFQRRERRFGRIPAEAAAVGAELAGAQLAAAELAVATLPSPPRHAALRHQPSPPRSTTA
jgi:undecaprenyl diphosphate synthase